MRVNTLIIKAVYNMCNDNKILKWNYNIIKLLKSINKEEAYTYKKFQLIDWQDVDTNRMTINELASLTKIQEVA